MLQTDAPALSTSYLSTLLGAGVKGLKPANGGRNSRVYTCTAGSGEKYAVKLYMGATADGRSRISAEFHSLSFLRRQGLTCVPRPIIADESRGCAVYEFVDGTEVASSQVIESDVDQATRFLVRLHDLRGAPGAAELSPAAEACFSLDAVIRNIDVRLQSLLALHNALPPYQALGEFLARQFLPAFHQIASRCRQRLADEGRAPDAELQTGERTLSPSDFGFHNCLRRPDGRLAFVDFEYFGWDDPAKMVCDFLLHPAMDLSHNLKRRFVAGILGALDPDLRLARRTATFYPMFGLKWCLILLNEFLPSRLPRREHAAGRPLDAGRVQAEQLEKSRQMLRRIELEYEHFPYHG